ncbi:MAG: HD domain-containing protein [Candidatus Staskawiczbacteria bacterium]|nr:HD domain-containing protein [Candidatus Staskawiczbacteria bacterium]
MIIPKEVKNVIGKLEQAGYEAYIVGGCVRDFLLGIEPKDWDVTTNAKPEEIQKVFPDSFYENNFLTVTARTGSKKPELAEIEITTYRLDAKYSDKRHPDEVKYAEKLEDDLSRRDFTVNAMALRLGSGQAKKEIVDLFEGQKDLKNKIIRTVGKPEERFNEDALRMLRAVRFATTLGFTIEEKTAEAIKKNSVWLEAISKERIRDEFVKIIMADKAAEGIELLREMGLLKFIVPELLENYGVAQNKHHIYDSYQHLVKSLEYAAKKKFNMYVRLAALLHDVAKARIKAGKDEEATFYNHEIVGAKMTFQILNRLKFSKKEVEKITKLVRYHMFYYNVDEVGESSVRRLIKNVGPENIEELLQVRLADRIGSGVPKAEPYKLRHFKYLVDKVSKDPISAKMLKVDGADIMKILDIKPGPKIGQILDVLLGYVLDEPKKNTKEFLEQEVAKLGKLGDKELEILAEKSKEEKFEVVTKQDEMTKQKYWVT